MDKFIRRQAQELQTRLAKAQAELSQMTTEVSSGGGAVRVVIDGQQKIRSIKIDPEVVDTKDMEFLEDMIMAAVNEAVQKSQELATSYLSRLTGGVKLPGL